MRARCGWECNSCGTPCCSGASNRQLQSRRDCPRANSECPSRRVARGRNAARSAATASILVGRSSESFSLHLSHRRNRPFLQPEVATTRFSRRLRNVRLDKPTCKWSDVAHNTPHSGWSLAADAFKYQTPWITAMSKNANRRSDRRSPADNRIALPFAVALDKLLAAKPKTTPAKPAKKKTGKK